MPTLQLLFIFNLIYFYPYRKMSCYLILTAMNAQLSKWAGEQYHVKWKIEIMCMLLIPTFLSFPQFMWWSIGIIQAREIPPARPTGSHSRSRARWCHTGMPGVSACSLSKCVKVQLFKDTSSTRSPSLSLYFSSHTRKLSGGHLLFLLPP